MTPAGWFWTGYASCLAVIGAAILFSCDAKGAEIDPDPVCKRKGVLCSFSSTAPQSLASCAGLMQVKHLKGTPYATMSQEVPACPKWQWVNVCRYR